MKIKTLIRNISVQIFPPFIINLWRFFKNSKNNSKYSSSEFKQFLNEIKPKLKVESIIVGNGPSLKYTLEKQLDFFKNKTIVCVNNFVSSAYFNSIKPEIYVLADPIFWIQKCSPKIKENVLNIQQQLIKKVNWSMYIILPSTAKEWNWFLEVPDQNRNIKIIYFNNRGLDKLKNNRFELYRNNLYMPHAQTVLVAAVFISLNIGFKTHFIVGGDLSLHEDIYVNSKNVVSLFDRHFYDDSEKEEKTVPFWKVEDENDIFKMGELFLAFSQMFKGFDELEMYSRYLGVKIYNASYRSFIDSFERYQIPN